ncbi:kinase-like domain-containing protein [Achaetomium macrosporum]|uniref:Kinase-like domain-containing protein n=1 Tax=Achaetomium macrosporum TaxID=79813 RepID=A0AAN7BZX7_9PEZI|nr:kinase-like domain-containing protein [Achaetomium macrosporum]
MSGLFRVGQVLRGSAGQYVITKQLQDTVWLATDHAQGLVVIKSVKGHFRVANERDVLRRFSGRSPYIRPLLDEIVEPPEPTTIVLRHLESHLWQASGEKTLNRKELKYVPRRVLEALQVMHGDGFFHADVKPDNVLVNYRSDDSENRFTGVQLADMGSSYPEDHKYAREGAPIGAAIWRSPEALFKRPWDTKTDIWSFGTLLISLIYGGHFNIFDPPGVQFKFDDPEYEFEVLKRQVQFFGPFPAKHVEIADNDTVEVICQKDKEFIGWFMKLDPRDRPSADEILAHEWWRERDGS